MSAPCRPPPAALLAVCGPLLDLRRLRLLADAVAATLLEQEAPYAVYGVPLTHLPALGARARACGLRTLRLWPGESRPLALVFEQARSA